MLHSRHSLRKHTFQIRFPLVIVLHLLSRHLPRVNIFRVSWSSRKWSADLLSLFPGCCFASHVFFSVKWVCETEYDVLSRAHIYSTGELLYFCASYTASPLYIHGGSNSIIPLRLFTFETNGSNIKTNVQKVFQGFHAVPCCQSQKGSQVQTDHAAWAWKVACEVFRGQD